MMIQWRKSSHSQGQGGTDCVEVASMANAAMIRDSKDPYGPRLAFTRSRLRDLISDVKAGRYDVNR
jgi:Mrp family chromosome partitioning ATPase